MDSVLNQMITSLVEGNPMFKIQFNVKIDRKTN